MPLQDGVQQGGRGPTSWQRLQVLQQRRAGWHGAGDVPQCSRTSRHTQSTIPPGCIHTLTIHLFCLPLYLFVSTVSLFFWGFFYETLSCQNILFFFSKLFGSVKNHYLKSLPHLFSCRRNICSEIHGDFKWINCAKKVRFRHSCYRFIIQRQMDTSILLVVDNTTGQYLIFSGAAHPHRCATFISHILDLVITSRWVGKTTHISLCARSQSEG